jgi:hypothetical protein
VRGTKTCVRYHARVIRPTVAHVSCLLLALAAVPAAARQPGTALPAPGDVLVILWFDTEDYLLPASDDAAGRVAEILSARGVRSTFKVVGEKARVLERRRRTDVIAALRRHDIGYHSNLHSVHPTPAEYLADTGWSEGVAEFARREGAGARDVMRIFDVPSLSCYGQPGSSWAPQAFAALRDIGVVTPAGVPAYVDEGTHVGIGDQPFWFDGVLTVFNMGRNSTRMELHEPGGLEQGQAAFKAAYDRLRAAGGGLISIYYHPAEWVHREFWDAVNFSRGANPPREEWKAPGQRSPAETEAAFTRFAAYIDFQRALPGVRHVTAADLPGIYRDRLREQGADRAVVDDIAARVAREVTLDVLRDGAGRAVSPADQFALLIGFLADAIDTGALPARVAVPHLVGPAELPPGSGAADLPWPAFRDAAVEAAREMRARSHVPARVFVGATPVAPADFVRAAASVISALLASGAAAPVFPARVAIPAGTRVATERFVADDSPELFGGWVIHPTGFRAPRLVEHAKLQAWTLKPAER